MRRPAPATVRWLILVALLVAVGAGAAHRPAAGAVPAVAVEDADRALDRSRTIYFAALLVTLYEVALAMLIACGARHPGRRAGRRHRALLRNLLLPVFSSLYAVPIVILYPIFTAWFGIGSESKIAFAGVYGFFPGDALDRGRHPHHRPAVPARRAQHGRQPAAADHPRHHSGLDPDRARRLAAGRRAHHHRRGGVRDADLVGRHRLSGDAHTAPSSTARACSPAS